VEEIGRDVALDYECAIGVLHQAFIDVLANLLCPLADLYAASAIGVFARLDYPQQSLSFFFQLSFLKLEQFCVLFF
jgi:hypothetical protein